MKRFLCWLRFGHVWKELGDMDVRGRKCTMWQCAHCALTELFDVLTGERK